MKAFLGKRTFSATFPISALASMFISQIHNQDLVFLPPHATAGIQTHFSRVAPTPDLLKDALPTELPRRVATGETSSSVAYHNFDEPFLKSLFFI